MKTMKNPIKKFADRVLFCKNYTVKQIAWHEAGHNFFWQGAFPEVETYYTVLDGTPAVMRKDGKHDLVISELSEEDASKHVYIKLGGIAAEIIELGLVKNAQEIANFVADDYLSANPMVDWRDDENSDGDVSSAFKLIKSRFYFKEAIKKVFTTIFQSCISNISNNMDNFKEQANQVEKVFAEWHKQGLWEL